MTDNAQPVAKNEIKPKQNSHPYRRCRDDTLPDVVQTTNANPKRTTLLLIEEDVKARPGEKTGAERKTKKDKHPHHPL